ncbi:hypothetical protein MKW92_052029 [Papaver armeniacum]|nr:hypothetical protein MKW92_052029 [Papaver armeniacum]
MDMESPLPTPNELGNGRQRGGVLLTWDDLWVTVPSSGSGTGKNNGRALLQGLNGYAQPSEILAIMGPSGSQAYVTQDNVLTTTLTVKECVYYSALLQLPNSMTRSENKERAEATIRDIGLQDAMKQELEDGRRVSLCIEILTRPNLLFLDEPTSGLDSTASYHVVDRIMKLSQQYGMTVIASVHQPSSEVFDLFHNLCLLSSGRTVYFGPASAANEFFALNGFPCPTMRNPSDHFLRTINKDFDRVRNANFANKIG